MVRSPFALSQQNTPGIQSAIWPGSCFVFSSCSLFAISRNLTNRNRRAKGPSFLFLTLQPLAWRNSPAPPPAWFSKGRMSGQSLPWDRPATKGVSQSYRDASLRRQSRTGLLVPDGGGLLFPPRITGGAADSVLPIPIFSACSSWHILFHCLELTLT